MSHAKSLVFSVKPFEDTQNALTYEEFYVVDDLDKD